MRWRIRKAEINTELCKTFERYGVVSLQVVLAVSNYIYHKGKQVLAEKVLDSLLPWLTEEYDKADRKQTWSITMEIGITFFVAVEVLLPLFHRLFH